jgi:hypothetical protein
MRIISTLCLIVLLATPALAHDPRPGPNGGLMVDAGTLHTELLANGTDTVIVYLFDAKDAPVDSAGVKGNAILIINGKPARFPLEPAGGSTLKGQAPAPVAAGVKGAVQITLPDGSTIQAKY